VVGIGIEVVTRGSTVFLAPAVGVYCFAWWVVLRSEAGYACYL